MTKQQLLKQAKTHAWYASLCSTEEGIYCSLMWCMFKIWLAQDLRRKPRDPLSNWNLWQEAL